MAQRVTATVTQLSPSFVLALDDWGVMYFVLFNAVQATGQYAFQDLKYGSKVELTPIDHPKGKRGIEVRIVQL